MKVLLKVEHIIKSQHGVGCHVTFDKHKIVDAILKSMTIHAYPVQDISHISKKLNLTTSDLVSILTHARIKVINNQVSEEGIQYLVNREVGKIKRYFEHSIANYTDLSAKEQRIFNVFLKRYGIKYKKIKSWEDLKIEAIRNDCHNELTGNGAQTFYDGKFICYDEIETADNSKSRSIIQLIRRSLVYNIKKMRKWIRFKIISNTTTTYILTHHFHIFTSDDSNNSIHSAKNISMFNLPQNAKNYILAA